ncbi:MAG: hypothetical protein U9O83_02495 [Campylobacterota bacterium]|nr:hypothetical protein [Campylobacterota bacterium]
MHISFKILMVWMLLFSSLLAASESYQVAFETTECNGDSGFATVKIENIDKIKAADCLHEGKKLKQLLVRRGSSYVIYTLTENEAKNVMQDVKLYNRAKLKMMENSKTILITK